MNLINKKNIVALACLFICVLGKAKEVARIPFESHNGTIIVTVKLNDFPRPLKLLFDTGADGMAVDQGLADSIGLKITRTQKASVVGGSMDISVSTGNTVHMGNLILTTRISPYSKRCKKKEPMVSSAIP